MKKYFIIIISVALLTATVLMSMKVLSKSTHPSSSYACGKVFESVEDLDACSEIIIVGNIMPKQGQEKVGSFTKDLYPVEIAEVIKNTTSYNIVRDGTIVLGRTLELDGKENINEGRYLLFINTYEINGKVYYNNNSINNLYMFKNTKYSNVYGHTGLSKITASEVEDLRTKYTRGN